MAYPVWTTGLTTRRLACSWMSLPERCYSFAEAGAIPYSYIDRKVYYKRQDIIRFMENNIHRITL